MKEKFLQFFTGKMSKSIYISIAAAVVCGAVVITSTVIVHNNNQKIDSMQESLSALQENIMETPSESVTESVSDTDNTELSAQAKAPNGEPAGDKALQYLAEYDKLTAEYQAKRAELEEQAKEPLIPMRPLSQKPERRTLRRDNYTSDEVYSQQQAKLDQEYTQKLSEWESISAENVEAERQYNISKSKSDEAKKKLEVLDMQYQKDIDRLKAKYGIV